MTGSVDVFLLNPAGVRISTGNGRGPKRQRTKNQQSICVTDRPIAQRVVRYRVADNIILLGTF